LILTIERKQIPPDITVLEMMGRIIMGNTSRDVERKVSEALRENAKKIIFDLTGVMALDSTGVGIIVVCKGKISKEGGELRIVGANGLVQDVLKMTSVDKLVLMFPTVQEAAAHF